MKTTTHQRGPSSNHAATRTRSVRWWRSKITVLGALLMTISVVGIMAVARSHRTTSKMSSVAAEASATPEDAPFVAGPARRASSAPVTALHPLPPTSWESTTEDALRTLAQGMAPEAQLDSVTCHRGTCRLEISHGTSPDVGDRLNELIRNAIPFLPDSALQPDVSPGRTLLTLSRGLDYVPAPPLSEELAALRVRSR